MMRTTPSLPMIDGVGVEAAHAGADAAGDDRRRVGGERHHQGDEHDPVAVEVVRGDQRADGEDREQDDGDQQGAEAHDALHDGTAALADRAAVREGPTELLLEGQEEPGGEGERREPQRRDRLELLVAADGPRADLEERVRRDPADEQGDADRRGALGQWGASGRRCGHESTTLPSGPPNTPPPGAPVPVPRWRHGHRARGRGGSVRGGGAGLLDTGGDELGDLRAGGLQALDGHHREADADVGGVTGGAGHLLERRQLGAGARARGRRWGGRTRLGSSNGSFGSSNVGSLGIEGMRYTIAQSANNCKHSSSRFAEDFVGLSRPKCRQKRVAG